MEGRKKQNLGPRCLALVAVAARGAERYANESGGSTNQTTAETSKEGSGRGIRRAREGARKRGRGRERYEMRCERGGNDHLRGGIMGREQSARFFYAITIVGMGTRGATHQACSVLRTRSLIHELPLPTCQHGSK